MPVSKRLHTVLTQNISHSQPDSRRIFHGRGSTYPGYKHLVIDWYAPVLWMVLFREPEEGWLEGLLAEIQPYLSEEYGVECLLLQRRYLPGAPSEVIYGCLPEANLAREDGLSYKLTLGANQNCGFFPDMAIGRRWVREQAAGKRVLNLFSYTCAFSVVACAGGAHSVVNIDMSRSALKTGQANHALNNLETPVRYLGHDIFRSWKKLRQLGPYDLMIIDPPAFQKGSFIAENDYGRLIRRLAPLAEEGAEILATINAPYFGEGFLIDLFAEYWPEAKYVERLANSPDFPDVSEESSLKVMRFRAEKVISG